MARPNVSLCIVFFLLTAAGSFPNKSVLSHTSQTGQLPATRQPPVVSASALTLTDFQERYISARHRPKINAELAKHENPGKDVLEMFTLLSTRDRGQRRVTGVGLAIIKSRQEKKKKWRK